MFLFWLLILYFYNYPFFLLLLPLFSSCAFPSFLLSYFDLGVFVFPAGWGQSFFLLYSALYFFSFFFPFGARRVSNTQGEDEFGSGVGTACSDGICHLTRFGRAPRLGISQAAFGGCIGCGASSMHAKCAQALLSLFVPQSRIVSVVFG